MLSFATVIHSPRSSTFPYGKINTHYRHLLVWSFFLVMQSQNIFASWSLAIVFAVFKLHFLAKTKSNSWPWMLLVLWCWFGMSKFSSIYNVKTWFWNVLGKHQVYKVHQCVKHTLLSYWQDVHLWLVDWSCYLWATLKSWPGLWPCGQGAAAMKLPSLVSPCG